MALRATILLFVLPLLALPLFAAEPLPPEQDFDDLLGDWEFTANSKQWGTFHGLWSAVRLAEGQILDEYRIVGDDGKTIYVTTTLRNSSKAKKQWELVGVEAGGSGRRDFSASSRSSDPYAASRRVSRISQVAAPLCMQVRSRTSSVSP